MKTIISNTNIAELLGYATAGYAAISSFSGLQGADVDSVTPLKISALSTIGLMFLSGTAEPSDSTFGREDADKKLGNLVNVSLFDFITIAAAGATAYFAFTTMQNLKGYNAEYETAAKRIFYSSLGTVLVLLLSFLSTKKAETTEAAQS